MIGIDKIIWNERKLFIIKQIIDTMPKGFVKYTTKKFLLLPVFYEKKYGSFNSPF